MNISQAVILGIIQGLTEFLPISSSGHLVAAQKLMGLEVPPVSFDILVHVATLGAIFWWLKDKLRRLSVKTWVLVAVGSVPAAIFGLLIRPYTESVFNDVSLLGWGWIVSGVWLLATAKRAGKKVVGWGAAIWIGIAQAIAILPSVSRSGSTIATALLLGVKREEAMTFSLLLAIPAIVGAQLVDLGNLVNNGSSLMVNGVGFIAALVTGVAALKIIQVALNTDKFHWFGWYCLILGGGILAWPILK